MHQPIRRNNRQGAGSVITMVVALVGALALIACGGSSPTSSTRPSMLLSSASLAVNGQPVNGQTLSMSHVRNGVTRFQATLLRDGAPYPGQRIEVAYQRPGSMGMMNRNGTFMLYDDGTHGDEVAGDGIYCYQDDDDDYGCTGMNAVDGDYHYDFCGYDEAGHASNHMEVTVTVSGS